MRRVVSFLSAFILIACCAAAHAESIPNPNFTNWSKFKPGTSVVLGSGDEKAGTRVILKLLEKDSDRCVLEITVKSGEKTYPARKQSEAKEINDPDVIAQYKASTAHLTDATITTPAGTFKCKYADYQVKDAGESKAWLCDDVPGRLVRAEHIGDPGDKPTVQELISIDKK